LNRKKKRKHNLPLKSPCKNRVTTAK